jgi:hypothetical protein
VGPTLRDFRIWGFGVSNAKQQHTTTPEFQKVKGCGTNTWRFRDLGFRGFKFQTTTYNNSQILKGERMWDQHFGIFVFWGFGVWKSKGTPPKCNQQVPNAEIPIIFIILRVFPCTGILTFFL